jgi:hypothetical protein
LNNYVVNTTPDPKIDEVVPPSAAPEMRESRFSHKMRMQNFQGLPELPEEPNGEAENENSSGDAKQNNTKVTDVIPQGNQGDHKSNADAYTLKTTQ